MKILSLNNNNKEASSDQQKLTEANHVQSIQVRTIPGENAVKTVLVKTTTPGTTTSIIMIHLINIMDKEVHTNNNNTIINNIKLLSSKSKLLSSASTDGRTLILILLE